MVGEAEDAEAVALDQRGAACVEGQRLVRAMLIAVDLNDQLERQGSRSPAMKEPMINCRLNLSSGNLCRSAHQRRFSGSVIALRIALASFACAGLTGW